MPIQRYQQAVASLKSATNEVERLVRIVCSGADSLRNWKKTIISNVQGGFPMEVAFSTQANSINGSEWPTAQQLADALQRYHKAKEAVENAYHQIPEEQQSIVQPPHFFM